MRDIGRLTTQIRDAEVRLQTLREFEEAKSAGNRSFAKIERLLALELAEFELAFAGWETQAIPLLESAHAAVAHWKTEDVEPAQLCRAFERSYKCGRKALAVVRAEPTAANVHQLRKQVKWLGYEARLLRPLHPVLAVVAEKLAQLGELLGRVHDLSFLATRICQQRGANPGKPQELELLMMFEHRRATLQHVGIAIAESIFARSASAFISDLPGELQSVRPISRHRPRSRRVRARVARISE